MNNDHCLAPRRAAARPARRTRLWGLFCGAVCGALAASGCDVDLGERTPPPAASFGTIVFREACQRVTYSAEIAAGSGIDVSGTQSRAICTGTTAPDGADPTVRALFSQRDNVITGTDRGVPDALYSDLDGYLQALQPLQDDGTLSGLISQSADLLRSLSADAGLTTALARLGGIGGIRPASTAGGVIRAAAAAPSLDTFIGASLPILDRGGPAEAELRALLTATAFELRHLSRSSEPATSPERSAALLSGLLTSARPELAAGTPLLIAQRDPRGLPLLADIVAPYTPGPDGLPRADADGRFLDAAGQPIPYVAPLPEPGAPDKATRDAAGRALRSDGKLLYRYADLDGSLLRALLAEAPRLLADAPAQPGGMPRDMLLGLLRGASLLAGARTDTSKSLDGEALSYRGFDRSDSALLDAVYGAAQLLRFRASTASAAGQDVIDAARAVRSLLAEPANESPLARGLKALLDAADESKRPAHAAAKLPADSTLFDDLVPVLQRLLAVDDGKLAEDVVAALTDPHALGLGAMAAQLTDERGYFFMRQLDSMTGTDALPKPCVVGADEANNGLLPCGVLGSFGHAPDRSAPDSDTVIDWRTGKTDDPRNNRSVFQRLLGLIADGNGGRPLCNGRNANIFSGLVSFDSECDMFRVENVAQFFLLSIASPALRERTDTYAKPAASFLEAIKSGNNCRGTSTDPRASDKCTALTSMILDGMSGDSTLAGMMGIKGFGRYPDPPAAARAIFLDLSSPEIDTKPIQMLKNVRSLMFNFVKGSDGKFTVDAADPDNRKFRDGAGKERLFVDEHNGVLFALEKVQAPATLADGTKNPTPGDSFYDAMRPLVDAFAKHGECLARDTAGTCTRGQNATQILADLLTVMHRHYPTARSSLFGRAFAASYGDKVRADGASLYEPLVAKVAAGDLLLGAPALAQVLYDLTVDGQVGGPRALPLFVKVARYALDPALAPAGGLTYRDGTQIALRNDGQPAGPVTLFYLLADARRKKQALFDLPGNQAARERFDRALSDAVDALLGAELVGIEAGKPKYRFKSARLRPIALLGLDFSLGRLGAHKTDLAGWADKLVTDATDALTGPLAAAGMDVAVKLSDDAAARAATYALLREIVGSGGTAISDAQAALTVAAADAVQLLLDEDDVVPAARALSLAADPQRGPALAGITLMRRGRELEQASPRVAPPKQVLVRLLQNLLAPDTQNVHALSRLSDAIAEVNRKTPGSGDRFTAADYGAVLGNTALFLTEQTRGLLRFISIVQSRCLPGSLHPGCPRAD